MEGNQEREFMMTFRNYNDRLENIRGFRKGLNPFLLNGSLLGLKVKWVFGGHPEQFWVGFPQCDIRSPSVKTCQASVLPGQQLLWCFCSEKCHVLVCPLEPSEAHGPAAASGLTPYSSRALLWHLWAQPSRLTFWNALWILLPPHLPSSQPLVNLCTPFKQELFLAIHFLKQKKEMYHKHFSKMMTGRGSVTRAGQGFRRGSSQTGGEVAHGGWCPSQGQHRHSPQGPTSPTYTSWLLDPQPSWAGGRAWRHYPVSQEGAQSQESRELQLQ